MIRRFTVRPRCSTYHRANANGSATLNARCSIFITNLSQRVVGTWVMNSGSLSGLSLPESSVSHCGRSKRVHSLLKSRRAQFPNAKHHLCQKREIATECKASEMQRRSRRCERLPFEKTPVSFVLEFIRYCRSTEICRSESNEYRLAEVTAEKSASPNGS